MLLGELSDCIITSEPTFRVSSKNIMMETKAIDSGSRVRLYVSHPVMMYYFIHYCEVSTRHHFTGALNISAFTFDDSSRAFVSIRMSVDSVRPLLNLDDQGNVVATTARKIPLKNFPRNRDFLKMEFIVYKYVWENIDNEKIVLNRGLNVDSFALQLHGLYEKLVRLNMVLPNFNPVVIKERVSEGTNNVNSGRPVPRVIKIVYNHNPRSARLSGWDHESLTYNNLINDTVPFDAAVIISPNAGDITTDEEDNIMGK